MPWHFLNHIIIASMILTPLYSSLGNKPFDGKSLQSIIHHHVSKDLLHASGEHLLNKFLYFIEVMETKLTIQLKNNHSVSA